MRKAESAARVDWQAWGQLVRIPNTLTACADVLAGMCIVGGTSHGFLVHPWAALVACASSISFYWGGMILNDVFDVEVDRLHQRAGPLATGRIPLRVASRAGYGLLGLGVVGILFAVGCLPPVDASGWWTWLPAGAVAVGLALCIWLYDGPCKRSWVAPWIMGLCRGLNFSMGMALVSGGLGMPLGPAAAWIVGGYVLYVAGLTWGARREERGEQDPVRLTWSWAVCFAGAGAMAMGPRWALERWQRLEPTLVFPGLFLLLLLPLLRHAILSVTTRDPRQLGRAIKQAIVSMIFLDAAMALQFAGNASGLIVCGFVIPTLWLGNRFRVT